MEFEEFERIVGESFELLPGEFKEILEKNGIRLLPRERAPRALKAEYPGSVVFGIFAGAPYGRFADTQIEPSRIELYQDSFERVFGDPESMRREIRRTVMHEIGHYFGFSEREIRQLTDDIDDRA